MLLNIYCYSFLPYTTVIFKIEFYFFFSNPIFKAIHKETKQYAALKQVVLEAEEDLETFMIEIDILSECKHENIVELLEAYHFDGKLWVSKVSRTKSKCIFQFYYYLFFLFL